MSVVATELPARRLGPLLPPIALATFGLVVGAVVWASGDTFGFDFLAYHQAAGRVLAGQPLYDTSFEQTGGFGLFYYPPPFVLPLLPLALLDGAAATAIWFVVSLAAFFGAIALMPVSAPARWGVVLLAGQMWPVAYTFKLGQVTPLLMLAFVVGWRWLADPVRVGAAAALGAIVKIQPVIVLGWAALLGRWRTVAIGFMVLLGLAAAATAVVGAGAWFDYATLLRQVSDPVTTPHNFTPGAIAFQLTGSTGLGEAVQVASTVAVILAVLAAVRWATPEASYLAVVVASQLLSPTLWDHYATLLLLPVAWLLHRGVWLAALVPLSTSLALVSWTPAAMYPALFGIVLVGVLWIGIQERRWAA